MDRRLGGARGAGAPRNGSRGRLREARRRRRPRRAVPLPAHLRPRAGAAVRDAARSGALPAAAALAAFELDVLGPRPAAAALLPAGEGRTWSPGCPPAGDRAAHARARRPPRRRAHRPDVEPGARRAGARRSGRPPFSLLPELALAAVARGPRRLRAPARRAARRWRPRSTLEVTRGRDRARRERQRDRRRGRARAGRALRGRAAARTPRSSPCFPGCEESGMGGMAAGCGAEGRPARPRLHVRPRPRHARRRGADGRRRPRGRCGRSATGADD